MNASTIPYLTTETLAAARGQKNRRHKYGVATATRRTAGGIAYDSRAEMLAAGELELRQKAGEVICWLRQVCIPLGD